MVISVTICTPHQVMCAKFGDFCQRCTIKPLSHRTISRATVVSCALLLLRNRAQSKEHVTKACGAWSSMEVIQEWRDCYFSCASVEILTTVIFCTTPIHSYLGMLGLGMVMQCIQCCELKVWQARLPWEVCLVLEGG